MFLHQLVFDAAQRSPDAPALRLGDERITYGALAARAQTLARALIEAGVRPGDRVGTYQLKSLAGVADLIAILAAGAAYVPVDPQVPPDRARYIFQHAGVRVAFSSGRILKQAAKSEGLLVEHLFAGDDSEVPPSLAPKVTRTSALPDSNAVLPAFSDQQLAYILYTSGSTGAPKGVAISHAQSLAFVAPAARVFELVARDVLASHAPFNFDLSVIDLWCAFWAGAEVALVPEGWLGFPAKLAELIERAKITVWNSVPSALIQMLNKSAFDKRDMSSLRLIMFAGEPFPPKHLRKLAAAVKHAKLLNVYGQTEANSSTYYPVLSVPEQDDAPIPIGRCFPGYEVLLLGDDGRPVAVPNVEGELYVIGGAVASGYWDDAERSAKAFVQHPLVRERRQIVYRTGDRVLYDERGDLIFRGRVDLAVKCRGFRVELGEVEAVAAAFPGAHEVCVVPVPNEEAGNLLYLYLVAEPGQTIDEKALRAAMAEKLPRYMLPELVFMRSELPRGPTGKVDRKLLKAEAERLPAG